MFKNRRKTNKIILIVFACVLFLFLVIAIATGGKDDSKEASTEPSRTETTETAEPTTKQTTTAKPTTTAAPTQPPTEKHYDLLPGQSLDMTVYRTASGEHYHYENPCGSGDYTPITLKKALDLHLTPCEKCVLDEYQ